MGPLILALKLNIPQLKSLLVNNCIENTTVITKKGKREKITESTTSLIVLNKMDRGMKTQNAENLRRMLQRLDGRGYKAYKDIRGDYDFRNYILIIDHVQGDPFALPSAVRVRVPQQVAGFAQDAYKNKSREVALRDYLARRFFDATKRYCKTAAPSSSTTVVENPENSRFSLKPATAYSLIKPEEPNKPCAGPLNPSPNRIGVANEPEMQKISNRELK